MRRVIIFGNSASGKSTLAKNFSDTDELAHLDLDTLAWQPTSPPTRRLIAESARDIGAITTANVNWVIEGCYADLINILLPQASEIIFMDLPVELCISNARQRPWEPHKYASKAAQDANLAMLIDWISQYEARDDEFSYRSHTSLYENFQRKKTSYVSNPTTATDLA